VSLRDLSPGSPLPAMRVAPILRAVAVARAHLLLVLWAICAAVFYLVVPALNKMDSLASVSVSVVLWAFAMAAACHAVLWAQTPTLMQCLSASARAILYTSGLVFVIMTASFFGFFLMVIPGLVAMVMLSLSVPITMRERPGFFASFVISVRLTIRYWGTALIITLIGGAVMIAAVIAVLIIAAISMQEDLANSPLYDALLFGALAVASGVLGSSRLLAIREVDAGA